MFAIALFLVSCSTEKETVASKADAVKTMSKSDIKNYDKYICPASTILISRTVPTICFAVMPTTLGGD